MKFKVGDRVKCIQPESSVEDRYNLTLDIMYTVIDIDRDGSIKFVNTFCYYKPDRFVLASKVNLPIDPI